MRSRRLFQPAVMVLGGAAASLFLLASGASGLGNHPPASGSRVEIQQEWSGVSSGFRESSQRAVRSPQEWQQVWEGIQRLRLPRPDVPLVDFKRSMIIAVFLGERASGGWAVSITGIRRHSEELIVDVQETSPSPDSARTLALTQPYHIVLVEDFGLPVRFQIHRSSDP